MGAALGLKACRLSCVRGVEMNCPKATTALVNTAEKLVPSETAGTSFRPESSIVTVTIVSVPSPPGASAARVPPQLL